jgi:hypothetical protein
MRVQFALVAGLLLSSCLPITAQTPAAQIVLAQTPSSPTMILFRTPRVRLSLIAPPIQLPREPLPHPAFHLAAAYKPEPSLESRLPIEEVRTSFLTESSFQVVHLWRGLRLDVSDSTIHFQSLRLGSSRSGGGFQDLRVPTHDQAGIAKSVEFDGINLKYSFGRDTQTRRPGQIWRAWLGL